jgi:chemotaxis response regulator CheB
MYKLLIIDQCKSFRSRLTGILVENFPQIKVFCHAENYNEADNFIHHIKPDLIASELIEYEPNSKKYLFELRVNNPQAMFILMSNFKNDNIKKELNFVDLHLCKTENLDSIISTFNFAINKISI